MATYNYSNQDVKGIREVFDLGVKADIESLMGLGVFNIESTDEFFSIFTSTESFGGTRFLSEEEAPDTDKLGDGYSKTLTSQRFGTGFNVTEDDMEKRMDSTVKVRQYLETQRNKALLNTKNFMLTQLHAIYNNGFSSSSDYLAPDALSFYNASHKWNSNSAVTWDNADTAALSETSYQTARAAGADFTDAEGNRMPMIWDTIFVKLGSSAAKKAIQLFASDINPTQILDVNVYQGTLKVVESPYLTSDTAWHLIDTKNLPPAAYMGIKKMPRLSAPIAQNNNSDRFNVTGYAQFGVNHQPINHYGSTGAA